MIIVLINATIAAVTENNANDALEALSSLQSPQCTVVRDGNKVNVESRDLVPGDIVCLSTGDVVPADVRCIKTSDFRVNEVSVCACAHALRCSAAPVPVCALGFIPSWNHPHLTRACMICRCS